MKAKKKVGPLPISERRLRKLLTQMDACDAGIERACEMRKNPDKYIKQVNKLVRVNNQSKSWRDEGLDFRPFYDISFIVPIEVHDEVTKGGFTYMRRVSKVQVLRALRKLCKEYGI